MIIEYFAQFILIIFIGSLIFCFHQNEKVARIAKSIIALIGLFFTYCIAVTIWGSHREWDWYIFAVFFPVLLICMFVIWKPYEKKIRKITSSCLAIIAFVLAAYGIGNQIYHNNILEIGAHSEEVYLRYYEPFRTDTLAKSLDDESDLNLRENLPRLDGATALYPLYAAFGKAVYPEGEYAVYDDESAIVCSRTANAFERLLDGSADIIFLMGVSEEQRERARERGWELTLTPIGREAFVFFVNNRNRADNLTVGNIQDIYTGKIDNWRNLGGRNKEIIIYQRPESSGSQVMLKEIMGDIPIIDPPNEFIYDMMKEMYNAVAYKNYQSAIGYSFLFYINDMIGEDRIKFLAIEGVSPTAENIQSGAYPFAHDFYAITIVREPETEAEAERIANIEKFIKWILSPQGQSLVEKTGYVPLI
jgi:phosphate transport system substrate-binding protein